MSWPDLNEWNVSKNLTKEEPFLFPGEGTLPYLHWTFVVAKGMITYALPIIIVIGLVGNIASFLVFLSRDLRKLSSSVYVIAVLTSDTGLLVGLLFVWLEVLGIRLNHAEGACQFLVFLTYACSFLSVWYTVCITAENYIAICHPTRVRTLCTRKRATIVVSALAAASMPLYFLSAASTEVRVDPNTGMPHCQRKQDDYLAAMHVFTIADSVITLLLPLLCVTSMLVAIALSILHTYRWRRSSPGSQKHHAELMRIPQVRVAKMLFALSLSFVVMNSPSHVCRLYYMMMRGGGMVAGGGGGGGEANLSEIGSGWGEEGQEEEDWEREMLRNREMMRRREESMMSKEEGLVQLVLMYGSYCYYAVKFILFLTFSKNFRRSIRDSCKDGCCSTCVQRPSTPVSV
ncbi:hypothetical protein ACOMHN_064945 [Nucella lapillus]